MSRQSIDERFVDFEHAVISTFRPPGLEITQRSALKRRRTRHAVATVAVLALAAIPFLKPIGGADPAAVTVHKLGITVAHGHRPDVKFADSTHGWVLAATSCDVLACKFHAAVTDDAGRTWQSRNPPIPEQTDQASVYPLDAQNATILVSDAESRKRGYLVTRDGGQTFAAFDSPPDESLLAIGGRFQEACPRDLPLEIRIDRCQERPPVVEVGVGAVVLPQGADADHQVEIGPDGRVWLFAMGEAGMQAWVSEDETKSWIQLGRKPEGVFVTSPDGKQAWVLGAGIIWRLDGKEWVGDGSPHDWSDERARWGTGAGQDTLIVGYQGGAAYLDKDRVATVIPAVRSGAFGRLDDGTITIEAPGVGLYLGAGVGTSRSWVLIAY